MTDWRTMVEDLERQGFGSRKIRSEIGRTLGGAPSLTTIKIAVRVARAVRLATAKHVDPDLLGRSQTNWCAAALLDLETATAEEIQRWLGPRKRYYARPNIYKAMRQLVAEGRAVELEGRPRRWRTWA